MPHDTAALDQAFAGLAAWDWGTDTASLTTIDGAVVAAHADAALRADLERRLVAALHAAGSRGAKEEACRRLCRVGSAACVPALAALLPDRELSHMARFALERIDGPEAGTALVKAAEGLSGDQRIGALASLAARRDAAAMPVLAGLLTADEATAAAAATALGAIATHQAAAALEMAQNEGDPGTPAGAAIADARLACAETLRARGDREAALAIMRSLAAVARGRPAARQIEMAATRGMLACLDTSAS
jgi:hypothetical protein